MENNVKNNIPNKAYDMEYSTQYRKEVDYLSAIGFKAAFIKKNEYGVKTYKYTKTPELFKAIAAFYEAQRNEKQYNYLVRMIEGTGDDSLVRLALNSMRDNNDVTEMIKNA